MAWVDLRRVNAVIPLLLKTAEKSSVGIPAKASGQKDCAKPVEKSAIHLCKCPELLPDMLAIER